MSPACIVFPVLPLLTRFAVCVLYAENICHETVCGLVKGYSQSLHPQTLLQVYIAGLHPEGNDGYRADPGSQAQN